MNYSDKQTEEELKKLERELSNLYKRANSQTTIISADYLSKYAERDEEMREALKDRDAYKAKYCVGASAHMTPEQHYKQWRLAQIGRGKRWEAVRADIAQRITETNLEAQKLINKGLAGIYATNHNYTAYEIEKKSGIAFNLVNENAIEEMNKGKNHTEFRTVKVNPKRDYNWNSERINNALTAGLLQGKSINRLTEDFMQVMGSNRKAAVRNARTAVTSAQNAGREAGFEQAVELGIELEREWIATSDARTRDSHAELDGVRVAVDEPFPNGCMYPGDPAGEPAEVYNCRCTMRAILPKYNGNARTEKTVESYSKWLENKKEGAIIKENGFNSLADPMKEVTGDAEKSNPKDVQKFKDELKSAGVKLIISDSEKLGYMPNLLPGKAGEVHIAKGCSFSAWSHEMQHFYDDKKAGYPGYAKMVSNMAQRYEYEKRAYAVEIEIAKKMGRKDIVKRLRKNRNNERRAIYGILD